MGSCELSLGQEKQGENMGKLKTCLSSASSRESYPILLFQCQSMIPKLSLFTHVFPIISHDLRSDLPDLGCEEYERDMKELLLVTITG